MPEVTYRQLHEVLRSLGLTIDEPDPGTRVYNHPRYGPLAVYPTLPEDTKVYPHHLLGVRTLLDAFGIASDLEFTDRLQKAS